MRNRNDSSPSRNRTAIPLVFATLLAGTMLTSVHRLAAQQPAPAQPAVPQAAAPPLPEHPITEATLRKYFDICHFQSRTRQQLMIQSEAEWKSLPAWYPRPVWDEIVDATLALDLAQIALPVYQRYYSEELGQNAILVFSTPAGQALVKQVYDNTAAHESAGDSALDAHRKALDDVRGQEDIRARQALSTLTPAQQRKAETIMRSPEWKRVNGLSQQITAEFQAAMLKVEDAQMKEITTKHKDELIAARSAWRAQHPEATPKP